MPGLSMKARLPPREARFFVKTGLCEAESGEFQDYVIA